MTQPTILIGPAPATVNYGTDISCVASLDRAVILVGGRLVLAQALARRIITPRGALAALGMPNYGYDVRQWLNAGVRPADLPRIAGYVDAEFIKDQRVRSSSSTCALAGSIMTLTSSVQDGAGPFPLVLAVSSVTVSILMTPSTQ